VTSWTPDITDRPGPRYLAIAEAIAEDVSSGRLPTGERLPPHRELAYRLGVTVGTVSRAYAEAQRRGLLSGEVGRGTFVRENATRLGTLDDRERLPDGNIDLSLNYPPGSGFEEDAVRHALRSVADLNDLRPLLGYQHAGATGAQMAVAAEWLGRSGLAVAPDEIVVTAGLQHAMTVTLAALCEPGDTVAAEALTYPGIRAIGRMQHLRLQGVAMDDAGLTPEALDAACRQSSVRLLYTIPTLQNPTAIVTPLARRREIADVARQHDVMIVEDDLYGFLLPGAPPRYVDIAPERTVYLASTSKCLMPGLRVGFVRPPRHLVSRLAALVRTTLWMAAPPMMEVFRHLVSSGDADRIVAGRHREAAERQTLARAYLGDYLRETHPMSPHVWLALPETWQGRDFVGHARHRNVTITTAEDFSLTHGTGNGHLRLCLGCPPGRATLEQGLMALREILRDGPHLDWSLA
jgi:DNA-binding transcriptional MocR family regulator